MVHRVVLARAAAAERHHGQADRAHVHGARPSPPPPARPRPSPAPVAGAGRAPRGDRPGRPARPPSPRSAPRRRPSRAPARPPRAPRSASGSTPPSASSSALSASVTSRSRSSLAAPVRWSIDSRTSTALPAVRPSTRSMSVRSAAVGRPLPSATSTIARASSSALLAVGQERARADLHVHHERVEPGGELLRQDRGDDQRDRLDRAGGVADRVEAAVGRSEPRRLADDRGAGVRDTAARNASGSGVVS